MSKIIFNKIIAKLERLDEYLKYLFEIQKVNKIIPEKLAERFTGIANFRNILVHDYEKIDREMIYQKLQENLNDFKNFKKAVLKFLS